MYQPIEPIEKLVSEVLDGGEPRLQTDSFSLTENFKSGEVHVHCDVHDPRTGQKAVLDSRGKGVIDAFIQGLNGAYASAFPSLRAIRFAEFTVKSKLERKRGQSQADSLAEVNLRVVNSDGQEVVFTHTSPSITRSATATVLHCVEFFINSERAFIEIYKALEHARGENRIDSVQLYTRQLMLLVQATSYAEALEQLRRG